MKQYTKGFGFQAVHHRSWLSRIQRGYVFLCIASYVLFSLTASIQHLVHASPSEELFDQKIADAALYVSTYDNRAASVLLSMQRLAQGYNQYPQSQSRFLTTYRGDIENILQYLSNNPSRLKQVGLQGYSALIDLLSTLSEHKDDIFSLLGETKPQTYLILLQNTAEKRPNGGFFGSFVKVTLDDAHITDLQFVDSYVPGTIKPVSLQAPYWSAPFLEGSDTITFLASNKFGFTDLDGKNIKKIYDATYDTDIRGVLFVSSDLFVDLLPGFQEQLRERQFKNASIDLIRGEARPNKKELYFNGVQAFLKENQTQLIKSVAHHIDRITQKRFVQVYLSKIHPRMESTLGELGLQTTMQQDNLYLWDYNSSFNKVDTFVSKTASILDNKGNTVKETVDDVISLTGLPSGKYTLHMQYSLSIPQSYHSFIESLAKKFDIELNVREKHILAIYPQRSTRGVVYAPSHVTFGEPTGPLKKQSLFTTPFSHNAFYVVENTINNSIVTVSIPFTL